MARLMEPCQGTPIGGAVLKISSQAGLSSCARTGSPHELACCAGRRGLLEFIHFSAVYILRDVVSN